MGERTRVISSIVIGAVFPALVLGVAATAPIMNDRFISPVDGRILTLGWWFMVPLGVAAAVLRSRRMWTGAVIGVLSVVAFQLSMVLVSPVAEEGPILSAVSLGGAALAVGVPWAIGMVFSWSSLEGRPRRIDGVHRDTYPAGGGRS